jgi:hypothetical protein
MGGYVAHMGELRNTKFWSENQKERDHSEDISVNVRIILELISGKRVKGVVQDRYHCRAPVNTVMNFRFPEKTENLSAS